jgi:antitoxin (DNA-binding transcriptional repressor) of toxin-antitoxin stability system
MNLEDIVATTASIKDFRADLAKYIDSGEIVEVTRHGQTVGRFIPQENRKPDPEQVFARIDRLRKSLIDQGIDPEEIVEEFDQTLKEARRLKREHANAGN